MSKELLKGLIDIIDESDVDTIFKVPVFFISEDKPLPDEIKAIEEANRSIEKFGTVPHDAIDWDQRTSLYQDGRILPLNVRTEAAFRGHLMMTLMAAVIFKLMSDKLKKTSLTTESMFMNLHEQHAVLYDDVFITTEPMKRMNEAYKDFKVQCPATIPRKTE